MKRGIIMTSSNKGIYSKSRDYKEVQKPEHVFTEMDLKHPDQVVDYLLRNFDQNSAQTAREDIKRLVGNNIRYLFKSKKNKFAAWNNIILIIGDYYRWTDEGYNFEFIGGKRYPYRFVPVSAPERKQKLSSKYNQLQNSHGAGKTIRGTEEVDEPRDISKAVYAPGYKKEKDKLLEMLTFPNNQWHVGALNSLSRLSDISRVIDVTLGKEQKGSNVELHQEMLFEVESKGAIHKRHIENKEDNAKDEECAYKRIAQINQRYNETLTKYQKAIDKLQQISKEQTQQDGVDLDDKTSNLKLLSECQQATQKLCELLTDLEKEKHSTWEAYVYRKDSRQKETLKRERERFSKMFPEVRKER